MNIQRAAIALAAILLAVPSSAQTPPPLWNRGASSFERVSLNGLPPGTRYIGNLTWYVTSHSGTPLPLDLSTEIRATVNGVLVPATDLIEPLIKDGPEGDCPGLNCLSNSCAVYTGMPGVVEQGRCVRALDIGCDCGRVAQTQLYFSNFTVSPGDVIVVSVSPAPGSVGELLTTDDSLTYVVPPPSPFSNECDGNGQLSTPCPCGNYGLVLHGCSNSANPAGALLTADGSTTVDPVTGTDTVVLHGSGMPATSTAIYLKGDLYDSVGSGFGDGVLCVGGSLIRLRTKTNVGGASSYPEAGEVSLSVRGQTPPGSGLTGHYTVFYRNAASYCTAATFNVSNGMKVEW